MNRRKFLALTAGAAGAALVPVASLAAVEALPTAPTPDVLDRLLRLAKCLDASGVPSKGRVLYLSAGDRDDLREQFSRLWTVPDMRGPAYDPEWRTGYLGQVERFAVYCDPEVPPGHLYAMHHAIPRVQYRYVLDSYLR